MKIKELLEELSQCHIRMNGQGYSDLIHFDFKNRVIGNGKTVLFKNGKTVPQKIKLYDCEFELEEETPVLETGSWEELESLYSVFRNSVPEPYDDVKYTKCHFIGLGIDELTREEFAMGKRRQTARIELESYLFFHKFKWQNEKHHYWQSKNIPQLIVYRDWIQGE